VAHLPHLLEQRIALSAYCTENEWTSTTHGRPYPASSDSRFTSVGATGIEGFLRPVCYENLPAAFAQCGRQHDNPLGVWPLSTVCPPILDAHVRSLRQCLKRSLEKNREPVRAWPPKPTGKSYLRVHLPSCNSARSFAIRIVCWQALRLAHEELASTIAAQLNQ
jgi:hypothetical protein